MKDCLKKIQEIIIPLSVLIIIPLSVLCTVSCATNNVKAPAESVESVEKPSEPEKATEPEKKPEPQKPKFRAFTKSDFIHELSSVLETGTNKDALALFEKIPEAFADDFDLLLIKASLLYSEHSFDEASAICKALLERDPGNADVLELNAMILQASGNTGARKACIDELLKKDPYSPAANIMLADDEFKKHNYKKAHLYYQTALARDPKNEDALFGAGRADYFLENDDRAEEEFKRILENNPNYAPAWAYLGKLAAAQNEYYVADGYGKKAVELDPLNYDYIMDYGMYERELGRFESAEKLWTKAISMEPDYFLAYAYRGGLYDENDRFTEALNDYQMVVKLNPDYYYAYESIAILAFHDQKWETAINAFKKCQLKNPNNISYPLMITYCYYMAGKPLDAKSYSNDVLRKMNRAELEKLHRGDEWWMLRAYHDQSMDRGLPQRIAKINNTTQRGKMNFYLGLFNQMLGSTEMAREYYAKVVSLNSPMFFEYRIAEWNVGILGEEE